MKTPIYFRWAIGISIFLLSLSSRAESPRPATSDHAPLSAVQSPVGKQVFDNWCAACHGESPFLPGTSYLAITRGAELSVIEKRKDLSPDYVRKIVRVGINGMPPFRKTEITGEQLEALIAYLTRKQ